MTSHYLNQCWHDLQRIYVSPGLNELTYPVLDKGLQQHEERSPVSHNEVQKPPQRNATWNKENSLTHCGLVMLYGDLDQYWLRWWLDAWWHQAITWTNADFSSVRFCDIHLRAISQQGPELLFGTMSLLYFYPFYTFEITTSSPRGQWVDFFLFHTEQFQWHKKELWKLKLETP